MPESDLNRAILSAATPSPVVTSSVKDSGIVVSTDLSGRHGWNVRASKLAKNTHNRIRSTVESLDIKPNPEKYMIPLSIGDPTIFGNLSAPDEAITAVMNAVASGQCNGYAHSQGREDARKAISKYSAHQSSREIAIDNICICSGCSAALEYCILTLADRGKNILTPCPGFCQYETLAAGLDIEVRYYNLLPEQQWQIDLRHLENLIDGNTAALLINNPSNPCGSVFSKKHLEDIVAICEKHYLPIISDEIYEHFVFPGVKHIAISTLSKGVPVLSCSGLTKRFLVPGWRLGWIIIHDPANRLGDVAIGLKKMCSRIVGSNTIIQAALSVFLTKIPATYFENIIHIIYSNAKLTFKILSKVRGLRPIMPKGAMYMMVGVDIAHFPEYKNDTHFVQELVNEQSVFCLPGSCFEYANYMRIVLTVPADMMEESCVRIADFCELHYRNDTRIIGNHLLQIEALHS